MKIWAKVVLAIAGLYLLVAIPGPFVMREMEASLENVGWWIPFAILSLGFWGFIVFAVGAIPVAVGAWAVHYLRVKRGGKEHAA
jgi:hypothetical protein